MRKDRKNTYRKPTYLQHEKTTSRSSIEQCKEYLNKQDVLENLPVLGNKTEKKALKRVKLGSLLT
jgi:hypothetical protein